MCENCDEEFDVAYNSMGDCSWHEGKTVKDFRFLAPLPRCTRLTEK